MFFAGIAVCVFLRWAGILTPELQERSAAAMQSTIIRNGDAFTAYLQRVHGTTEGFFVFVAICAIGALIVQAMRP